ncbi:response regulator [Sphaerisporangium corydalis]|uniref:Response regulator n=1 Tax=Sphaerisporangium corydalis TaxID=1441875 RepID=A0ABV9E6U6_9ACTN|nr:response regulator [Sphaerisporangium corydalis]
MAVQCLIVDDNVQFLHAARDLLEREEITIVGMASTVTDALRVFEESRPDVTLVDFSLGGMRGFDLARRLVEAGRGFRSAVILISTYAERDVLEVIAGSPAVAFLPKYGLSGSAIRAVLASGGHCPTEGA